MNGKQAKHLRYKANQSPVRKDTFYEVYPPVRFFYKTDPKTGIVTKMRTKGTPRTMGMCVRAIYKEIKKTYKTKAYS